MRACQILSWAVFALIFFTNPLLAKETPTISAETALHKLEDGNRRFVEGKNTFPDIGSERRRETSQDGQHPFATVISCSDSRLPVEITFDQGIGDIFVVRVAGNVCNVDEIGSAEYGADHLGTPVLVVLGHSKCGAVTAVVDGDELHGSIPALVHGIVPAVEKAKKAHPDAKGDALVSAAIEANVWQSIEDLFKKSPLLLKRVQDGKLKIVGANYDIESGKVKWLGEHPQQARLLESARKKTVQPKHWMVEIGWVKISAAVIMLTMPVPSENRKKAFRSGNLSEIIPAKHVKQPGWGIAESALSCGPVRPKLRSDFHHIARSIPSRNMNRHAVAQDFSMRSQRQGGRVVVVRQMRQARPFHAF